MNDVRSFHAPRVQLQELAQAVMQWYQSQQFEVMSAPTSDGLMIQARHEGGLRTAFGTGSALQIVLTPRGEELVVEIGAGKWGDKAAVGAVGVFLLWPLAFTAAYGAYQQSKLPERTFEFIERYLAGGVQAAMMVAWTPPPIYGSPAAPAPPPMPPPTPSSATPPAAPAAESAPVATAEGGYCTKCGHPFSAGAAFCEKCGTKLA